MIQQELMPSRSGQDKIDTSKAGLEEMPSAATMDRPKKYSHLDLSEITLYSASTLRLHGLSFDYDALRLVKPLDACPICSTDVTDPLRHEPLHTRIFSWKSHMGRCGGDGRRTQAREVVKMAIKRLALCNHYPGGIAIPSN